MNITPVTTGIAQPAVPVQTVQTDQAKESQLAEAQSSAKQSVVYFSPVIKIDRSTNTAIFQYRDRATGEITREFPNNSKVKAYEAKSTPAPPPAETDSEEQHIDEDA